MSPINKSALAPEALCPCGHKKAFARCCGRFINRQTHASTAEQLMRSRYSAFVLADGDYLLHTWHPNYRPQENAATLAKQAQQSQWIRLKVLQAHGGPTDDNGVVEFKAFYKQNLCTRQKQITY